MLKPTLKDFNITPLTWDVDGGVTATGMLSRQRGNLITIGNTQ